jgi:hypothetical protein
MDTEIYTNMSVFSELTGTIGKGDEIFMICSEKIESFK